MVRPRPPAEHGAPRDEHAWERLCARKRDEIERDTRLLSDQQQLRCERAERLYADLEAAAARAPESEERVEDGVLDLRSAGLRVFAVPPAVERALGSRLIHTLCLRGNKLRALDARTLAPLVALMTLDVSRNELERLGPTGAARVPRDHARVLASHPGVRETHGAGGFPPRLAVLLAAHNRIQKLGLGAAGAPSLKRLNVSHNVVRFIAPEIAKAPNLEDLDLRDNQLRTLQLKHLAPLQRLVRVRVGRNPLCADRRHGHAVPAHVRNALSTTQAPVVAPRAPATARWAAPAAAAARRRDDPPPAPPSLLPRDATTASAFSSHAASAFGAPLREPSLAASVDAQPSLFSASAPSPVASPARADPFASAASAFGAQAPPAALAFGAPSPPAAADPFSAAASAFGAPADPFSSAAAAFAAPAAAADPFSAAASAFGAPADPFAAAASSFADPFAAPAPAAARSLRDRLLASGAVDTLPRAAPASESESSDESDGSGSEYSEDGPDWIEGWDPNHAHVYYFNHVTEVTSWTRPRDVDVRPMSAKDAARRRADLLHK